MSRTVTAEAYARLTAEGYLQGRHGSGTCVCHLNESARPIPTASASTPADRLGSSAVTSHRLAFRTGVTDPAAGAPVGWGPALREVARSTPPNHYVEAPG